MPISGKPVAMCTPGRPGQALCIGVIIMVIINSFSLEAFSVGALFWELDSLGGDHFRSCAV